MRLALALGMTLRRLDADMGADELSLWRRFEEEFGLADGFTVAGILAPLLATGRMAIVAEDWASGAAMA